MNFEKTQNKLDELRNLTWQNGKLIEQVETLTNMLEEKDDSALVVEIEEAKENIAAAINTKGGSASADSSFKQLADDILAMPTSGIFANGVTQTAPFEFLKYITTEINEEITEIEDDSITLITRSYAFANNTKLKKIKLLNLSKITAPYCFEGCTSLEELIVPRLQELTSYCFSKNPFLKIFNLPSCVQLEADSFRNVEPYNIVFGKLTNIPSSWNRAMNSSHLRNITIGNDTDVELYFHNWKAANVIDEGQSGIDELNNNLYNNLLTKLYDHSQDGQTRTLRLGWLAKVSQENIDYANSKGWTLTT